MTTESPRSLIADLPYPLLLLLVYGVCGVILASLLFREIKQIEDQTEAVARERGAMLFRLIELTRDWNAMHGGVYVPVTEFTQPNPYLGETDRDVVTDKGVQLTKINPAYMTRQIAAVAERAGDVRFHITSLQPVRPENSPDPWEAEVLQSFQRGVTERIDFIVEPTQPVHRFMAPLLVKPSCLKCHAEHGYELGSVRGGISVTMPAQPLLQLRDKQRDRVTWLYVIAGAFVAALAHLLLARSRRHILRIRKFNAQQDAVITERTRELSMANDRLEQEVVERQINEINLRRSEERYRAVVEYVTDGVFVTEGGKLVFVNEHLGEMIDRSPAELTGRDLLDIIHPEDRELVRERRAKRTRGEPVSSHYRVRLLHRDLLTVVIADFSLKALEAEAGTPIRLLGSVRDVTAELEAEREGEIAAAVFDNAAEAILVSDARNQIVRVNPAFTKITGYAPADVLGKTPAVLRSGRHDAGFYEDMWRQLNQSGRWQGEIWNRRKSGEVYPEWLSISRVAHGAGEGDYVATFTDITQRKQAEDMMRYKAHHDALTSLPNRALFYDRLHGALASARRYERKFALIFLDLDHFKKVNDTMGHAAGDALLIEASSRLMAVVRESDTVARLGGDEFAMLMPEVREIKEVEDAARRALAALERVFLLSAGEGHVSGSLGIAIYPDHGLDADSLQRHADLALYAAKAAGRNCYRVYQPEMTK